MLKARKRRKDPAENVYEAKKTGLREERKQRDVRENDRYRERPRRSNTPLMDTSEEHRHEKTPRDNSRNSRGRLTRHSEGLHLL